MGNIKFELFLGHPLSQRAMVSAPRRTFSSWFAAWLGFGWTLLLLDLFAGLFFFLLLTGPFFLFFFFYFFLGWCLDKKPVIVFVCFC